ncbi:MAG: hypothetical protein OK442_06225 [Thaumarchaeota archaeon]|nr:hypothetical protein [Nitrososphaerota archaeon]
MRGGGFFVGAAAGLAIALLVVGTASFLPQTNSPLRAATPQAAAQSVMTSVTTNARATSSTTNSSGEFAAPPVAQVAGVAGASALASSSTTAAPPAGAGAASSLSSASNEAQGGATPAGTQAQQEPSSLLAVLPGEGAGRMIATVSPLLVGLLVAALVYGAYARRQDSSS